MPGPIDLDDVASAELDHRGRYPWRVMVCNSTACLASGARGVRTALEQTTEEQHLTHDVQVVPTGCMGLCSRGPLVRVDTRGDESTLYGDMTNQMGTDLIRSRRYGRDIADRAGDHVIDMGIPFFARQTRRVLANAGRTDPERIEDYVAEGGYRAVAKALHSMTPAQVIEEVTASGLRGRGGAGYPTGKKWSLLAAATGTEHKYVVANGDEGDPGAFMDRTIMEDDPHRVLEGVILAAYATGADRAFLYVRAEYPTAVERLDRAIRVARRHRLLGRRILDTDFGLDITVRIGAGAFVCGEETALMSSIEGRRGTPRLRPPYPTERGLWGEPTMINNVETFANIPAIVADGAEAFASMGTAGSKGTKVFALAGNLVNTGLVEVPMGITLREIVEHIGGGIPNGHAFKAAQTGGPSGGCVPARLIDTPVDYESLKALGSIMGSGGLIVMDDTVKMPEVARYFMGFSRDESCGKCLPCRAGTVQLHGLLDRISEGKGTRRDLDLLERLCRTVRDTSLCGLGQAAPNPVLSTLEYFRSEYLDLLTDREPASA
jgi:bidirectional [NiFe] hydrogenase diaphorase subunit